MGGFQVAPTAEALARIAGHLREEHGWELVVDRDVEWKGHRASEAMVTFVPEMGVKPARFFCSGCPGRVFQAQEPSYGHPARNVWLRFDHPELESPVLRGVRDPEARERLTTDWDLGLLARDRLALLDRREGMATKKAARPVVEERRKRCQAWLLGRVREGVTVEAAIAELAALYRTGPGAYARVMGDNVARSAETLRKYWLRLDIADRNAARAQGRAVARP